MLSGQGINKSFQIFRSKISKLSKMSQKAWQTFVYHNFIEDPKIIMINNSDKILKNNDYFDDVILRYSKILNK